MALKKCKECGEQVSSKAEACPKCGAKTPKKTSPVTWLVLFFIIFVVYSANQLPSSTNASSSSVAEPSVSGSSPEVKQQKPAPPTWKTSRSEDQMTSEVQSFASSPDVSSIKRMDFPYHDTRAWLGVGCDGENEWAYIGFSKSPNLSNDETEDGYNRIRTRIKWDGNLENVELTQDWGAKFLHFSNDAAAISQMAGASSVVLELRWHGQQSVHFEFPLRGSSQAIKTIRTECA